MRLADHVEPTTAIQFFGAELFSYALAEYFRAAAGKHLQSNRFETFQHCTDGDRLLFRKVGDFYRCEGFYERIRAKIMYFPEQILKKGEGEFGMTASDNMNLGQPVILCQDLSQDFIFGKFKGERVALFPAECTETAAVYADIGIVYVPVYDKISRLVMESRPDVVGERANCGYVPAGEKTLAILDAEPLSISDSFVYVC
jgi:hypothetical protein